MQKFNIGGKTISCRELKLRQKENKKRKEERMMKKVVNISEASGAIFSFEAPAQEPPEFFWEDPDSAGAPVKASEEIPDDDAGENPREASPELDAARAILAEVIAEHRRRVILEQAERPYRPYVGLKPGWLESYRVDFSLDHCA